MSANALERQRKHRERRQDPLYPLCRRYTQSTKDSVERARIKGEIIDLLLGEQKKANTKE